MAKGNPYGNLAGYTDPSTPGWQDAVAAAVAENTAADARRSRLSLTKVRGSEEFRDRLDEACAARGIARSVYVRRAAAAFIAQDLGLTFEEVCSGLSPAWTKLHKGFTPWKEPLSDDGQGYGPWRITGLE